MENAAFVNSCVCTKRVDRDQISFHRKKDSEVDIKSVGPSSEPIEELRIVCGMCKGGGAMPLVKDSGVTYE